MSYISKEKKEIEIDILNQKIKTKNNIFIVILVLFILSLASTAYLIVSKIILPSSNIEKKNKIITNLKEEISLLENQNDSLKIAIEDYFNQKEEEDINPLIYMVQIGAFKRYKTQLYSNQISSLTRYENIPFVKYSLGVFDNYKDAKKLRTMIKRFGIYDVFVVAMYNQKQISIKEAIKYEQNEN